MIQNHHRVTSPDTSPMIRHSIINMIHLGTVRQIHRLANIGMLSSTFQHLSSTDTVRSRTHRQVISMLLSCVFDRHIGMQPCEFYRDIDRTSSRYHVLYLTDTSECSHQCEFYRDIGMLSHALPSGELDEHSRATNQCAFPTHWGACGGFWIASEYGGRKHSFKCAKSGTKLLTPFGKIGAALRDGMTIHSPSLVDEHSTRFLDTRGHCLVDRS